MDWAFEAKDATKELIEKFGNLNTPIVIKLCSKFKKQNENVKVNPSDVTELLVQNLNNTLQVDNQPKLVERLPLIFSEVKEFRNANGFLNVYLVDNQFADRIQVTLKKKQIK